MYQILFAFIAHLYWHVVLIDALIAFFNSKINVTIYMQLPIKYYKDFYKIVPLLKTLYGLKQSACQWASLFAIALKKTGLKPLYLDFFVYVCNSGMVKIIIVAIYIDNIFIIGPDIDKINALKR